MNIKNIFLYSFLFLVFVLRLSLGLHYAILDYETKQVQSVLGVTMERESKYEIKDNLSIYPEKGITSYNESVFVNKSVFDGGRIRFEFDEEKDTNYRYVRSANLVNVDSIAIFPNMNVASDSHLCSTTYANYHKISSIDCDITTLSGYEYNLELAFNDDTTDVVGLTLYDGSVTCSSSPNDTAGLSTSCKKGLWIASDFVEISLKPFAQDNWVLIFNDLNDDKRYFKEVSIAEQDSLSVDLIEEQYATGDVGASINDKLLCNLSYANYQKVSIADCSLESLAEGRYDLFLYYSDDVYEKLDFIIVNGEYIVSDDDDGDDDVPPASDDDDGDDDLPPASDDDDGDARDETDAVVVQNNSGGGGGGSGGRTKVSRTATESKNAENECGGYKDSHLLASGEDCEIASKMATYSIFQNELLRPNDEVMRYEAALLIIRALKLKDSCNYEMFATFEDVDKKASYYDELCKTVTIKILTGYLDDPNKPKLLPAKPVTLRELSKMIYNGLLISDGNLKPDNYSDVARLLGISEKDDNDWFGYSLSLMLKLGILNSDQIRITELDTALTRMDVARLLDKILE